MATRARALAVAGLLAIWLTPVAGAEVSARRCTIYKDLAKLEYRLPHTTRRIAAGEPLRVVAVGSSSTAGVGASSAAATYPSRLAVELEELFPSLAVTIVNNGVSGTTATDMVAVFDKTVFAEHPDLVLWQVGTNAVLQDNPLPRTESLIAKGLEQIRARGIDVVLIDSQYAPKVIAKPHIEEMIAFLAHTAKLKNVDLFRRYTLMRRWVELEHMPFETFTSRDMLHMNDWSYGCVAKVLAVAIHEAVTRRAATVATRQRPQ